MSRPAAKKYGPGGQYYRKRIRTPEGKYEDIYAKTLTELSEKVTLRKNQLAAASDLPAAELYVFEYAARWFLLYASGLSENMKKTHRQQINGVICPVIGNKPIKDVTTDDIAAVMATRAGLSRSSQSKTVQTLKKIFSAAEDAGAIEKDPTRKLKAGGKAPAKKKALTKIQQEQLLAAVSGLPVEPCVMLGLYTGMRREEICGLKWDCVDLDGPAPHVVVRRACRWPKNTQPEISDELKTEAAARTIPIPPQLVQYLQVLKAAQLAALRLRSIKEKHDAEMTESRLALRLLTQCVYAGDGGGPVSFTAFRRRWDAIRYRSTASGRELGTKIRNHSYSVTLDFYPTPHILRHTYITRLILGGMDLKRVQYLAGHEDPRVTLQIYTDLMGHAPEELIADVNAIFTPAAAAAKITPELPLKDPVPPT